MKVFDRKGVSPVIATILLIALTVAAIGSIVAFLGAIKPPTPPIVANISLDSWETYRLLFFHGGGDVINTSGLALYINDNPAGGLWSIGGAANWQVGVMLIRYSLPPPGLTTGYRITLVYTPTSQVLVNETLS